MLLGHVVVRSLDQVLFADSCVKCGKRLECTMRNALYQPPFGGNDMDASEDAAVKCVDDDGAYCCGNYATGRVAQG